MGVRRKERGPAPRRRIIPSRSLRIALAVAMASAMISCTGDASDDGASSETAHVENVATLTGLLPSDTRGVFAVDLAALLSGGSPEDVTALLGGEGGDPVLVDEPLATIGTLAETVDVAGEVSSALLAQTTDATDGLFLLAQLESETLDEVVDGSLPESAGTYGPESRALYMDGSGNHLALLPGGVLVVGHQRAVESVVDVADGVEQEGASAIVPFLDALDGGTPLSFVYGLPALFDDDVTPDRSLRGQR